jgi:betaine reductase
MIISRASGVPVITGALEYAAQLIAGRYLDVVNDELSRAKRAGLMKLTERNGEPQQEAVAKPQKEVVVHEIPGVEVMNIEDAVHSLWQAGIYAESGMGCTGPVILVSEKNAETAETILQKSSWMF